MLLILLILISFVSNLACFFYDLKARHPFMFLWLFNIPFVFVPMTFWVFYDVEWTSFLIELNFFILLCNFSYLIASVILNFSFGVKKLTSHSFFVDDDNRVSDLFFIMFFIMSSFTVYINLGNILAAERTTFHILLVYLTIFTSSFLVHYFKTSKIKFFATAFLLILWFVMYKSRGALAYSLMPLLFYFIIVKISFKRIMYVFLAGGGMIFIVIAMKAYRWSTASGEFDFEYFLWVLSYQWSGVFTIGDLSIIKWAKVAFDMCVVSDAACGAFTELNKVGLILSNTSSTLKSTAYLVWDFHKGESDIRGSLHALSYGISFLDGYWFGFVYFIFLAFLRLVINIQLSKRMSILIIGPCLYFITFFSRGSVFNGLIPLLIALVVNYILYFVLSRLVLRSKSRSSIM